MNKHDIIYRWPNNWLLPVWISQTQIEALDAVVAEHGRKWRSVVEDRWYKGTARDIGTEVYAMRNNSNQGWQALDFYTAIKKGKLKVTRIVRISPTKVIDEASLICESGASRYKAVAENSKGVEVVMSDLYGLEAVANWTSVLMEAADKFGKTGEIARAHLVNRMTGEVVEAYDPLTKTAVS